jgi:carbamate kinase
VRTTVLAPRGGQLIRAQCDLLACQLRADRLLLLTDVDGVYVDWGTKAAKPIKTAGAGALSPGDFAPGSMRPKIEAAMGFAAETGRPASIGRLEDAAAIVAGVAGTRIDAATTGLRFR